MFVGLVLTVIVQLLSSVPKSRLPHKGGRGETNGLCLGARLSWNCDTGG